MMIGNGGAAFPSQFTDSDGVPQEPSYGMTLRDYFAGQALLGLLAADHDCDWGDASAADAAYSQADAMLAARLEGET